MASLHEKLWDGSEAKNTINIEHIKPENRPPGKHFERENIGKKKKKNGKNLSTHKINGYLTI